MKRILVCEDEDVIRDFVVINLKRAGYDVCDVGCGEDALRVFEEEHGNFDIVLLDIMMPGIDGFTVCKKLREKSSTIGIIMLTARTQEMDKVSGLMFGADDYITKPFSMLLLGKRVMALLRRCGKSPELNQIQMGDITVDFGGYTASGPGGPIDLTPKEIDLLKLLVEHKGLVLTRSQILDELWGYDTPIIDRTIDTYIKNLRKKLSLDRIVTVKGVGYKYEEHP